MQFITSRNQKNADGLILMLAFFVMVILSISSCYAIFRNPSNPGAWSMTAFFIGGLILLLLSEEKNSFPDLPRKSLPGGIITWFLAWVFAGFLSMYLMTMNISILVSVIFLGAMLFIFGSLTAKTASKKEIKKNTRKKIKSGY